MKSFWQELPYHPRKGLHGNIQADVAIVGGGIAGVSAAYHCAKRGFKTVLVERDVIANGPAGKNMGLVVEGTTLDLQDIIPMVGAEHAKEIIGNTSVAQKLVAKLIREGISCDMKKSGSLYVTADKNWVSWLKREAALRRKFGFSCRFMNNPLSFEAGIFTPQDFLVHPVKYVRGLAAQAEECGAEIYERSPALEWSEHQVKTKAGNIAADRVIVAIESDFPSGHRKNAQVIVTHPLKNPNIDWKSGMLWETGLHYAAFRFWNNRFMIAKEIAHDSTVAQRKAHAQQLVKALLHYFPSLKNQKIRISHSWECKVLHTPRRIFTIAHKSGVYYPYGCAGNGLTYGTLAGKLLADHFSGKKLPEIYSSSSKISLSGCSW